MRNIKLTIAYDGTDYHGWQRQPDLPTIQGTLEDAVARLTGVRPTANANGRTDAGVHALGQVVNFLTPSAHPPEVFRKALNATLPPEIRVLDAAEVPQAFHATVDSRSKRYRYRVDNRPVRDPFQLRTSWHIYHKLNVDRMHASARGLLGRHDFRSFETNWPNRVSSVRTILDLEVTRDGDDVRIEVEADGFLYNMVRTIAGTLALVGTGRRPPSFPAEALAAQNRAAAGPTAPPQGLFLLRVNY